MKELNHEMVCRTVGELKELLKDTPDEWVLVTTDEEENCIGITHISTHWHGAITFEHE